MGLVNFPESLVVIFEQAIFNHFIRVHLRQVRKDFGCITHSQVLRFLERIDECVLVSFKGRLEGEGSLLGAIFVVESEGPRDLFLLLSETEHGVELHSNRHTPLQWFSIE